MTDPGSQPGHAIEVGRSSPSATPANTLITRQVDRLLKNMHNVFAHLAEMEPFLKETRTMLKEVVARVGDWEPASPTLAEASRNENGAAGNIEAFVDAGGRPESTWMGAS